MLNNLKALVVVLAIGWAVFVFLRPICLNFMTKEAFARRRNVWFALTIVGFVSPSFWIYAIVALFVLAWVGARDENPLALFAMTLFVIPNVSFYIPAILVNNIFDLTQYRILSLAIVIPAMFRPQYGRDPLQPRFRREDAVLAAFLLLQVVLVMPYQSGTATMRKTVLLFMDIFALFYAFSRLGTRERLTDVMASFWIGFGLMAPIAIFESLKGWLLYTGISGVWGDPNVFSWLFRGDSLRAQAAANHSINLGFHLSMALGFYLFLRTRGVDRFRDVTVLATLIAGLVVTYARGPWVTAICVGVVFLATRPDAAKRLVGGVAVLGILFGLMYVSPLKETVLDRLPFIGTADQETVEYRRLLAEVSWTLIQQNPFFGDPFVASRMESLRNGQGIIDIVNGYIYTALFNGLVGLALLVGFSLLALFRGFVAFRQSGADRDAGTLGAALLACMVAALVYVATAGYNETLYILFGLSVSYAFCCGSRVQTAQFSPAVDHRRAMSSRTS
ncbi:MAG TPA: O-antigen ligase family protein [Caldimonas sp.]|nr:O-antigen ligase family protein [Caldimonas sp.]